MILRGDQAMLKYKAPPVVEAMIWLCADGFFSACEGCFELEPLSAMCDVMDAQAQ
jgi:hypothetical protein